MDWGQLRFSLPAHGDENNVVHLQQENHRLKEQIEQLQAFTDHEIAQKDEEIQKLRQRVEELEAQKPPAEPKAPVYGRRDNPITTEKGLLDGRSNADMAFDQKCQLMEEYRKEFGHLNVRPTDPEKYVPLVQFIIKQRGYYRAFQTGKLVSTVNQDRIRKLEELGFEWSRRPDYETEFCKMLSSLKEFKAKYGHCCVNVIPEADPELVRFVNRQRKFLRDAREIERGKAVSQSNTADSGSDVHDESGDDDEHDPLASTDIATATNNEDGVAPQKEKRRELPKHWTQSMRNRIEELDDLFMTIDPIEIAPFTQNVADHCRTLKFLKGTKSYHPNTINWYQRFEEFRSFYKDNGHGLVPLQTIKSGGLKQFVRMERALYEAIRAGIIETHPVFERNIQFLKDHGFVYDGDAIKKEEERLLAIEVEKRRKELHESTPQGQVEILQKNAEEVHKRLQAAQESKKEAEAVVNKIRLEYSAAKKKMHEAEKKAATDPVGSIVHVRPRGVGKPGGRARVTRYFVTKVLQEEVKFYDVVYLDDHRIDYCIEGRFIEDAKTVSALLDLSQANQPPATIETHGIITRTRRKAIDSGFDACDRTKKLKLDQDVNPQKSCNKEDVGVIPRSNSAGTSISLKSMKSNTGGVDLNRLEESASDRNRHSAGNASKSRVNRANTVNAPSDNIPNTSECGYPATNVMVETKHPLSHQPLNNVEIALQKKRTLHAKKLSKDTKSTKVDVVIAPKYPIGTIVKVRSRGEQKPGGLGKVINFFASKVLSEFIPFYDVEYLEGKKKDTCIEGRFITDVQK